MIVAIRNKKTNEYVYGTDYRYNPNHQRTSPERPLLYELNDKHDAAHLRHEMYQREIGKDYELVEIQIVPIKNKIVGLIEKEIRKTNKNKTDYDDINDFYKIIEEILKEDEEDDE